MSIINQSISFDIARQPLILIRCWVYGTSTFVGYLTPNTFYANCQLYFKQFSLAWVHNLIVKTDLIQLIQFSISADFVYTQLNVKTVLY